MSMISSGVATWLYASTSNARSFDDGMDHVKSMVSSMGFFLLVVRLVEAGSFESDSAKSIDAASVATALRASRISLGLKFVLEYVRALVAFEVRSNLHHSGWIVVPRPRLLSI